MFCPNCGSSVPEASPYCPTCGTPTRGEQEGRPDQEQSQQSEQAREQSQKQKQTGGTRQQNHHQQEQTHQEHQSRQEQFHQGPYDQQQNYRQQYQQYRQPQPRTRLGITVGMLGAIIYFSALISPVILILLALYVLLMEDNRWLKGSAIKCVVFYLGFFFMFQIIDGVNYFLNIINRMIVFLVRWNPGFAFPGSVTDLLSIVQIAFFVLMGFGAFKMREIRIRKIDEFVDTHM